MAICPCARIAGPIATFVPLAVATGVAARIQQFAAAGRGNRATAGFAKKLNIDEYSVICLMTSV